MDSNPADTILHFIAKITDVIEFPVGDAEFDADLSRELEAELGRALSADERRVFLEAVEDSAPTSNLQPLTSNL